MHGIAYLFDLENETRRAMLRTSLPLAEWRTVHSEGYNREALSHSAFCARSGPTLVTQLRGRTIATALVKLS
jgi:hypothetical protein